MVDFNKNKTCFTGIFNNGGGGSGASNQFATKTILTKLEDWALQKICKYMILNMNVFFYHNITITYKLIL